jgi:hypothetical protein
MREKHMTIPKKKNIEEDTSKEVDEKITKSKEEILKEIFYYADNDHYHGPLTFTSQTMAHFALLLTQLSQDAENQTKKMIRFTKVLVRYTLFLFALTVVLVAIGIITINVMLNEKKNVITNNYNTNNYINSFCSGSDIA